MSIFLLVNAPSEEVAHIQFQEWSALMYATDTE